MVATRERFERKFRKSASGCWEWLASTREGRYGSFYSEGKTVYAHRYSYIHYKGGIPEGYVVCHTCDNTMCVNPDHLFLGSQKENVADRNLKKRQAKGSRHGLSKLTEDKVVTIVNSEKTSASLARQYGVSHAAVSMIRLGKTWKHVHEELC